MNGKHSFVVTITKYLFALFLCLAFPLTQVKADVSLFMQEALGASGEATSAGHTSIYFSNICADGAMRLRRCAPGESGVVIAIYPGFGANQPYEWMAIPLIPFLYGVENEGHTPLYTNGEVRTLLRETYRQNNLRSIIPDSKEGTIPPGRWQQMIGTSFNRDIYSFTLKTTEAEDARLIEKMNRQPNKSHFNTLYHNCADFAREVLNTYFARATHRDVLNDFTMTSPKAVARSLTRYAAKRPERLFHITKYPQLAGPIRRSLDNRNYSEMALVSKKYLVPQILFKRELLVIFAASYFIVGRFNMQHEYRAYATPEIAQLNLDESQQEAGQNAIVVGLEEATPSTSRRELESRRVAERRRIFGTKQNWEKYQAEFTPILQKAIADGLFADEKEVTTFFKDLELQSEPAFDAQGALLLRVNAYGQELILGLTRDNILSDDSNPHLAYKLLLAKVSASLNAKEKNRAAYAAFETDWDLLRQLSARSAARFQPLLSRSTRFLVTPEKKTFGQKVKKLFVTITH